MPNTNRRNLTPFMLADLVYLTHTLPMGTRRADAAETAHEIDCDRKDLRIPSFVTGGLL